MCSLVFLYAICYVVPRCAALLCCCVANAYSLSNILDLACVVCISHLYYVCSVCMFCLFAWGSLLGVVLRAHGVASESLR